MDEAGFEGADGVVQGDTVLEMAEGDGQGVGAVVAVAVGGVGIHSEVGPDEAGEYGADGVGFPAEEEAGAGEIASDKAA